MIKPAELRLGNYILQKINTRINFVKCDYKHFELLSKGNDKDLYPIVLKAEILENCGFKENKEYPLLPQAREFVLMLAIHGSQANNIRAYIKNNGECFARAAVNGLPVSNNLFHLHTLQNLYFAFTGKELELKIK
jgi:hypothetical protein